MPKASRAKANKKTKSLIARRQAVVDEKVLDDIVEDQVLKNEQVIDELKETPDDKAKEKNFEKTKAPAKAPEEKEPRPAPVEKEKPEKTKAPTPIPVVKEKEPKPVPTNEIVPFGKETTQPTISLTSMVPTENLPLLKATHIPSEDLPLSSTPTPEPTTILLPFDHAEVASSLEKDDISGNETHTSLKTDASQSQLVTDSNIFSEVEHYVQNYHGLQYGLIAVCVMLVLAIVSMLGLLRRRAKERKRSELQVADAAGVL